MTLKNAYGDDVVGRFAEVLGKMEEAQIKASVSPEEAQKLDVMIVSSKTHGQMPVGAAG